MLAELIQQTSLIIWDEVLMTHRRALETLDRTLRDLLSVTNPELCNIPFGGKVVVLGCDPRQILPVIQGGTKNHIIDAAITNSQLWSAVTILTLHKNMRLQASNSDAESQNELANFNEWILSIGEGSVPSQMPMDTPDETLVPIPEEFLIKDYTEPIAAIVDAVYTDMVNQYKNIDYLRNRAILCPKNDTVDEINTYIVSLLPAEIKQYLSCDKVVKAPNSHESYDILYPIELLNLLNGSNFPTHELNLKVGVPIMLLRNLNQSIGLCNGTRLIVTVTALGDMVIQATIMSGSFAGHSVLIPRIRLTLKNQKLPFVLERRQFPVRICYAMTINKSQGQTLAKVGIYLKTPVFTHGQLYVAISRVTSKKGLKILIEDENGQCCNTTKNIVYPEVLAAMNCHANDLRI